MHREELYSTVKEKLKALKETKDEDILKGIEQYASTITKYLIQYKPEIIEEALEVWNAVNSNNYLTQVEATEGVSKLINKTGEPSPKWRATSLFDTLNSMGLHREKEGIFNEWALFYTINWLYSDYAEELSKVVKNDTMELVTLIYKMSVSKLTDPDCPKWIRKYLELD